MSDTEEHLVAHAPEPEERKPEVWVTTMWCPHNVQVSVPTTVHRSGPAGIHVYFDVPECNHDSKPDGEFSVEESWAGT